jgi:hypothetical protein
MKTINLLRILLTPLFVSVLLISCTKDDDENPNGNFFEISGQATGDQQTPVVNSAGSASLTGNYNAKTNEWNYKVDWTNLNGATTAIQLYGPAVQGMNGTLITGLAISISSTEGSCEGKLNLTDEQEGFLLSGRFYYTIMTMVHHSGELRGQIIAAAR